MPYIPLILYHKFIHIMTLYRNTIYAKFRNTSTEISLGGSLHLLMAESKKCSDAREHPSSLQLSTEDHFEVCKSLKLLNNEQLRELGTALGLDYANLKRMNTLPGDMVDDWLKGMDSVLKKSGPPSWTSLIKALENIGQEGVASTIRKGKT